MGLHPSIMLGYLILFCVVCEFVEGHFYEANVTDLDTCKVHYSRSGSAYSKFYSISESSAHDKDLLLDFHFAVMAPSDAHILLAPSEKLDQKDPAYEIVIGAGGNTFCDIRRKQKSDVKASVRVKDLLSALDPHFFWLHISKDGLIEVGRDGEELAFISWQDPDPLPLKVISFSTWSGIEAKWYFDCQRKNETVEIEKPQTPTEKLRRNLLYHYDPYVRPVQDISTITTVSMAMQLNHIDLDEYQSSIEVFGMMKMAWHDEKMRWNPEDYDGVDALHIFRREIWQPELALYNGVDDGHEILKDSMMVAHFSGLIEWNPALYLKAWCEIEDLGKWPKDKHKCSLILGFIKDFGSIALDFSKNESSLIFHGSSHWSVLQADISDIAIDEMSEPAIFQMSLILARSSNFYATIYFTPFLLISVSTLLTFWMDPAGIIKISVSCVQLVLTTIMLLSLGLFAPNHTQEVPYLVSLYSFTLVAILIAATVAVVVVNFSRNKQKHPLPHIICSILTYQPVRMALLLPNVEMSDEYGKLNESREKLKSHGKLQDMWILLGAFIDRIVFVLYLSLTIYAIYTLH